MIKGFVFGKFLPFHVGHEALIKFAMVKCDFLSVLICCSNKETIPEAVRKNWITDTFENNKNVEVKSFEYDESVIPNTSVSDKKVSAIWAIIFLHLFPNYSVVITSEPYGDYIATFMGITHIFFDVNRQTIPISASIIKSDLFKGWRFLTDSVKLHYAIKVVINGTESTGKSTLAVALSKHYDCSLVLETGREIIPDSNNFKFEDLEIVAKTHAIRINKAAIDGSPLIIIDTDVYTTLSYSKFIFNKELQLNKETFLSSEANIYLYLNNDVDYVQDGTRLDELNRNLLDVSHRQVLLSHQKKYIEIKGNWPERFNQATAYIDKLIAGRKTIH